MGSDERRRAADFPPPGGVARQPACARCTAFAARHDPKTRRRRPVSGGAVASIATLISYCSEWTPLIAGDVISTGAPEGVGFAGKAHLRMKPGDVVEVEEGGIGVLRNPIVGESGQSVKDLIGHGKRGGRSGIVRASRRAFGAPQHEVFNGINNLPHPEEAAQRRSRRTHRADDPAIRLFLQAL
jgi:hypothetical protein